MVRPRSFFRLTTNAGTSRPPPLGSHNSAPGIGCPGALLLFGELYGRLLQDRQAGPEKGLFQPKAIRVGTKRLFS